jgi:5-methylcytosine-specific restriction endonuclease McrA
MIAAHPYCADCGATEDLTVDHLIPLAHGGGEERRVLCRSCNSRHGAPVRSRRRHYDGRTITA